MKLLYLSHPETDYGAENLYHGLCQLLGAENVVDFPYHYTFHGKVEHLQNAEVRNYLAGNTASPLAKGGYSAPLHWMPAYEGTEYSYEEIKRLGFDIILLPSPREVNLHFADRLKRDNCLEGNFVFADFEDSPFIRYDIIDYFKPLCIFKSNLVSRTSDIHPLPMASPVVDNPKYEHILSAPKKMDVYARLGLTIMDRRIFLNLLRNRDVLHVANIFVNSDHVPYVQYLWEIAASKIAICMRGHGHITVRHFEIPSFDTLMFMESLQAKVPYPFEDGKTCIIFDPYDIRDFFRKVEYYLENQSERERIAKAGREHLKKYHTCRARAQQFLEAIDACK